jgi:hypothetical protein
MRAKRSAKLAEYLSTYAILEHIGIHPTTLIEKRDAAVGVGVYVRDACDAGTTLLTVPSRRFCANSVLSKVGLKCSFSDPWRSQKEATTINTRAVNTAWPTSLESTSMLPHVPAVDTQNGIVTFLTGSAQWPELAWRLALEQHRSVSFLWGWLQSLPSVEEFKDETEAAERRCRVHHTLLLPYYLKGRQRIQEEMAAAYRQLRAANVLPCYTAFCWAVEVLMTRSLLLPVAWPSQECVARRLTKDEQDVTSNMQHTTEGKVEREAEGDNTLVSSGAGDNDAALELGVAPFLDLVNAADDAGRAPNAHIEVASSLEELPSFFVEETVANYAAHGRDGVAELSTLLQTHYYLCLTLLKPLRASEEVIVEWGVPVLATGVLKSTEDQLVSRLLKYKF